MADDGKLYIVITDQLPQGTKAGEQSVKKQTVKDKQDTMGILIAVQVANFLKQQTMKALNYGINQIGNFTGDYQAQRKTQTTLSSLSTLGQLGASAYAGFNMAGPVGAIASVALTTLTLGINAAMDNQNTKIQTFQNNLKIIQLQSRSGLNSLTNGSRGTAN